MITVDIGSTPAPLRVRTAPERVAALCAVLTLAGVAGSAVLSTSTIRPQAVRAGQETVPGEKKFTVMPLRFGVNPSITTSGSSITMSPDIAVEGGFIGWEGETYGEDYSDSNVAGPGDIGENDAQVQGEVLAVNEKPLGETAALMGSGIAATAGMVDHATASAIINTWEAPGRFVGAELWAAGAAADLAKNALTSPENPLPPMPASPPLPPGMPPSPPMLPPASPPPVTPGHWWWRA